MKNSWLKYDRQESGDFIDSSCSKLPFHEMVDAPFRYRKTTMCSCKQWITIALHNITDDLLNRLLFHLRHCGTISCESNKLASPLPDMDLRVHVTSSMLTRGNSFSQVVEDKEVTYNLEGVRGQMAGLSNDITVVNLFFDKCYF